MNRTYNLWEHGKVPFFDGTIDRKEPFLTEYPVEDKNAPCVIVIPGGAYAFVSIQNEGVEICEFLNKNNIHAFYLTYRVAPYHHPCMELDAKRAVRFVRYNAEKFGINPDRIGVMGFSAGGHLACMSGLRFDYGVADGDEIDKISSRPDSVCPCYAVASLNRNITHYDTRKNLLGDYENDELAAELTSENLVKDDTPPFFIWHTAADNAVNVRCSLTLADALAQKKIPFALHIFPYGDHGLGTAENTKLAKEWMKMYVEWLGTIGN